MRHVRSLTRWTGSKENWTTVSEQREDPSNYLDPPHLNKSHGWVKYPRTGSVTRKKDVFDFSGSQVTTEHRDVFINIRFCSWEAGQVVQRYAVICFAEGVSSVTPWMTSQALSQSSSALCRVIKRCSSLIFQLWSRELIAFQIAALYTQHGCCLHQLNTNQAAFLFNQRPLISTPAARPLIRRRSQPAQNQLKPPESSVGGLIISAPHPVSSSLASFPSGDFTRSPRRTHTLAHTHKHICDSVDPRRQITKALGLGLPDQRDEVIRQNLIFPQIAPLISAVFPATITRTPSPH